MRKVTVYHRRRKIPLNSLQIIRRKNLQLLLDQYGTTVALAKKLGFRGNSRVCHLLGSKGMGDKAARSIEKRLGLPREFMDKDTTRTPNMPSTELMTDLFRCLSDNNALRLPKKKLEALVWAAYQEADAKGKVEPEAVKTLIIEAALGN